MREAQKQLHKSLKDASKEEREELIATFKETNKEKHQQIKEQSKVIKEEIRSIVEEGKSRTSDQ